MIYTDENGNNYTIDAFGFRSYNVNTSHSHNYNDYVVVPGANTPKSGKGSFDTPSTMTPLFTQTEQFPSSSNQENSSRKSYNSQDNRDSNYTNETNHGTIGYNEPVVCSVD